MKLKWLLILFVTFNFSLSAQVKLKIGSITLGTSELTQASCVQIPIFIQEKAFSGRIIKAMDITIAFSGDISMIDGGITTNIFVTRAFTATDLTGITNPGTDLTNSDSTPTPSCTNIFNQAVQGGPAANFEEGSGSGIWFVNNDGQMFDYKSGFVLTFAPSLVTTVQDQEMLAAVLEIPLIANPGEGQLTLTPVVGSAINFFQWEDGGNGLIDENFDLTDGPGFVNICPQAIVSQPQSQRVCPGDDVTFAVNLSGPGPIFYQWRKDSIPMEFETSSTLELTEVTFSDVASYDCIITSSCANVTTPAASLSFQDPSLAITPAAAVQGLNFITFTANPSCEVPPAGYQWHDEDNNLIGSSSSLILNPAPLESSQYTLTMTDAASAVITTTTSVLVSPHGLDYNGDGFNTLSDLWFLTESWNEPSIFDVDNDGILTVADMMYINTGQ